MVWELIAMCGRFGLYTDLAELVEILGFEVQSPMDLFGPRWNIAPTTDVLTVRDVDGNRYGALMRWGLIPRWAKPDTAFKRPMFNARSETVSERPTFRDSFSRRRCLVPANGFFEWRREGAGGRTAMWIYDPESPVITFAGIWSTWRSPDGIVESCAILTTEPNSLMSPIHNRMPVILDQDWALIWLDDAADKTVLMEAMKPREWESMQAREVDPAVGSTRNDGPHLIEPQSTLF